jgi:5-formyltetrahydrofolate cyclo-ligase
VSDFSHQSKAELRVRFRAARRSLPSTDAAVRDVLADLAADLGTDCGTVAGYVPMPGEPGGARLPEALGAVCARLLLPVVLPDRDLDWARYAGDLVPASLAPAAAGLLEPAGPRLGPAAITEADLVVVPALAVDRTGVRLGRGGGSYDRALARVAPGTLLVAALYDGELVDRLPADPHDVRVHAVATPAGLTRL